MGNRSYKTIDVGITPFTDLQAAVDELQFHAAHRKNNETYVIAQGIGGQYFVMIDEDAAGLPIIMRDDDECYVYTDIAAAREDRYFMEKTERKSFVIVRLQSNALIVVEREVAQRKGMRIVEDRRPSRWRENMGAFLAA